MVTEERATVNLIGSDEVEGTAVFGAEETQIGAIERVVSASKKKGLSQTKAVPARFESAGFPKG